MGVFLNFKKVQIYSKMQELIEILKKNIYRRQRDRYQKGELAHGAMINLLTEHGYEVTQVALKGTEVRPMDDVLKEIFAKTPMHNNLKTPHKKYKEGRLEATARQNIVEKYSEYHVELIIQKKQVE